VKVIVVMAPRPVAVKVDKVSCLFPPVTEVIVVDEVPSETTTETRPSSDEKLTSRDVHEADGSEKVVWY